MENRASDLFAGLGPEGKDPRITGTQGTVRFDIRGAGTWRVQLEEGSYRVEQGNGECDLAISADEEDFVRVMEGKHNFLTALMQNRVQAKGNIALLLKLNVILRERAEQRREQAEVQS